MKASKNTVFKTSALLAVLSLYNCGLSIDNDSASLKETTEGNEQTLQGEIPKEPSKPETPEGTAPVTGEAFSLTAPAGALNVELLSQGAATFVLVASAENAGAIQVDLTGALEGVTNNGGISAAFSSSSVSLNPGETKNVELKITTLSSAPRFKDSAAGGPGSYKVTATLANDTFNKVASMPVGVLGVLRLTMLNQSGNNIIWEDTEGELLLNRQSDPVTVIAENKHTAGHRVHATGIGMVHQDVQTPPNGQYMTTANTTTANAQGVIYEHDLGQGNDGGYTLKVMP